MTAVNHLGWQVESYDRFSGWRRATRIYETGSEAVGAMLAWPIKGVELRVMEALTVPELTLKQYVAELGLQNKAWILRSAGRAIRVWAA